MRVVTFNIQHGRTPAGRVDIDLLGRVCAGFEADILGLQEVDVGRRRSGRVDTVAAVARATGLQGVFGPALRGYGNALLARTRPVDVAVERLPRYRRNEPRSALLATVDGISVAVTHLSIDHAEARDQLGMVVKLLRERPPPRLLLGDLNLRGRGAPTYPSDNPRLRIDHVAVEGLDVLSADVLPAPPVSDHLPLAYEVAKSSTI